MHPGETLVSSLESAALPAAQPGGQAEQDDRRRQAPTRRHHARNGNPLTRRVSAGALVDGVDQHAQAGVVEPVEAEGEPGELGGVVELGREGGGGADVARAACGVGGG